MPYPARLDPHLDGARVHSKAWASETGMLTPDDSAGGSAVRDEAAFEVERGPAHRRRRTCATAPAGFAGRFPDRDTRRAAGVVNDLITLITGRFRRFERIAEVGSPALLDDPDLGRRDGDQAVEHVTCQRDRMAGGYARDVPTVRRPPSRRRGVGASAARIATPRRVSGSMKSDPGGISSTERWCVL